MITTSTSSKQTQNLFIKSFPCSIAQLGDVLEVCGSPVRVTMELVKG